MMKNTLEFHQDNELAGIYNFLLVSLRQTEIITGKVVKLSTLTCVTRINLIHIFFIFSVHKTKQQQQQMSLQKRYNVSDKKFKQEQIYVMFRFYDDNYRTYVERNVILNYS